MRIYCSSMAHPKRLSKRLSKLMDIKLSRAQLAVSAMLGYTDWHELEKVTASGDQPPSKPDWLVSPAVADSRNVYQERKLFSTLLDDFMADPDIDLAGLIEELGPSASFPYAGKPDPLLDVLFPTSWTIDLNPVVTRGLTLRVGGEDSDFVVETLRRGVNGIEGIEEQHLPLQVRGYRTFSVHSPLHDGKTSPFKDVKPSRPVATIALRFHPSHEDGVLLGCSIELHPFNYVSEYLTEDEVDAIAKGIFTYLEETAIMPFANGPISGSADGVFLRLSGRTKRPYVAMLMDAFADLLVDSRDTWHEGVDFDSFGEPGDMPFGVLPIQSIMGSFSYERDEDEEEGLDPVRSEQLVADILAMSEAMNHAPDILANYLSDQGFEAESRLFAGGRVDLSDQKALAMFFEQVVALENAGKVPESVSIAFRHHMLDMHVGEDLEEGRETAVLSSLAHKLGDKSLWMRYMELGFDGMHNLAMDGLIELGVIPQR